jgi:hypothetical protein
MIFSHIDSIINQLITKSYNGKIDAESKTDLSVIVQFYQIVKEYIEAKNPNANIDDDPIIKEEVDQLIYLINLIITPAMRNILIGEILKGLRQMDQAETIIRDENLIMDEITKTKFNDQTIDSYMTNILPLLAIKYYTTTYSSDNDPDRKIVNPTDLFTPVIQILKMNKQIQITDESTIVQNLKEYLFPFMSNTYQNFIHHLKLTIYGYDRYLLNTYQRARILQSIL